MRVYIYITQFDSNKVLINNFISESQLNLSYDYIYDHYTYNNYIIIINISH